MKNRLSTILVSSLLLLASSFSNAHGEDKPGPNGGYIRMPGGYHTEVLATAPNRLKVYLLDINWKNPVVKDSTAQVSYAAAGTDKSQDVKATPFSNCKAAADHFVCELPKSVNLNEAGTLTLKSTRAKQAGIVATYTLPLSYKPEAAVAPTKDDHHHHH